MIRAGSYAVEVGDDRKMHWHFHDLHQLEYAFAGVTEVETATARFIVPPLQAVWIPAGIKHRSIFTSARAVSVFFDPHLDVPAEDRVRILGATPLMREMMRYATRWPISRTSSDATANAFFNALAYLVVEWLDSETSLSLPTTKDPLVAAAIKYTTAHLASVTLPEVCKVVGTSERTLRRAFVAATGMSWRRYTLESCLVKAMALLATDHMSELAIAHTVGFKSESAFIRSFAQYTGETPGAYRRRIRTSS